MLAKLNERDESELPVERRIIQVEDLPDQAGIAAALRSAFAARPLPAERDDDYDFQELLNRIN